MADEAKQAERKEPKKRVVWPEKRCPDCRSANVYRTGPTRTAGESYYRCSSCERTFIGIVQ